jgi:hypothetical protein
MTRPGLSDGGRVVASRARWLALVAALSSGVLACAPTSRGAGARSDSADAAVTFRSDVVTNPATWQNLWGSWPMPRYDHGSAYDSDRAKLVVFGGRQYSNGPYYTDTWEWDSARLAWNERTPAPNGTTTNSPAERAGPMMAYDPVHKKSLLFSGWQPAAGYYITDQWEWNGATATWTQDQTTGNVPMPRYGGTMVWDSDRQRIVLFGGYTSDPNSSTGVTARANDLWEWDGSAWTNRTPPSGATQPSPRLWHSATYDAGRKKMVVYGGNTGTTPVNQGTWVDETWEWDGSGNGSWTKITPTATLSYQSYVPQLAYDANRGKVVAYLEWDYLWEYDPTTPTWTRLAQATRSDTDQPGYTYGTFAYDTSKKVLLAFGGTYGNTRDMFEWDGTANAWTNRSKPVSGPIQRSTPAVAYDSKRGKTVLFGGYSNIDSLYKQDTWEWSGTDANWTNKTNANPKPVGRNSSALVYDSKRDQFLLWGGSGTGVTNDVWSLSGGTYNWSMLSVTGAAPPVTSGHLMFYDVARDKVILYIYYYNIWEFDPATLTWTQRLSNTTGLPTGVTQRQYDEVTFDSDRDKLLRVGGEGYQAAMSAWVWDADVWEWDPVTGSYTERPPAAGAVVPGGRQAHGLSYDTARRVVVMFGGYGEGVANSSQYLNDSWEWDGIAGAWTETTPPGVKPLARDNHLQLFDSQRATTFVFGGTVQADPTYGPQEIWEYFANTAPRPNGSGCSTAAASSCASGFCVDGVCCNVPQTQCAGTCMACNVQGKLGTCSPVPAGLPDDTCLTGQACDASHQCKATNGHMCSTYSDCASGHCADGVCCDTDCNDTCKVCNLTAHLGTCSPVATGSEDPGTCVSDATQPRYCDASSVCTNGTKANGAACTASGQCTSGFCIDGYCCSTACTTTCYSCGLPGTLGSCAAIPPGQVDHSATTPCDGSMQYCLNGTCASNKKANGLACSTGTDCGSGFCVDSTCCNSACTGQCQSCGVAGSLGSCVNLPAGMQDTNSSTMCAGSQYCDGKGACQSGLKANGATCAAGTECGSMNCVDGVCCDSTCTTACYACNLPTSLGACTPVAAGANDGTACASPMFCTADAKCMGGKKANGATCTLDSDCGSNNCIDKVCCESSCGGKCRTCANATGSCVPVGAGLDPRNDCNNAAPCGGKCDGQGACAFAPAGKTCAPAGCQDSTQLITNGNVCDGAGNCNPMAIAKDCNGFGCYTDANGVAQCRTDCATDPQCPIRRYCQVSGGDGGVDGGTTSLCPMQLPLGSACIKDTQCQSGTCALPNGATVGVCCITQCSKCGSCDATGMCHPFAANTDPNGDCMDNASDPMGKCGGMCDGHAKCLYPAAGASCGTCKTCNGTGLCTGVPADDATCGTIDCSQLTNACTTYNNLTTNRCASLGVCKTANSTTSCTDKTTTGACADGGTAGAGGGGRGGTGGAGGPDGSAAGSTGTDGSADAGTPKGGGGGCGCDLGGADPLTALPVLLIFGGVVTARRRRR